VGRFTDDEVRRYSRQMVLPEVGGIGQERLRAAHALADDEIEALYLAAAGVGTLTVPSEAIAINVRALNPGVNVSVIANANANANVNVEQGALRAVRTIKGILSL
jgi:molybdopterin/thiamine biosynthesis adenylyltransferase